MSFPTYLIKCSYHFVHTRTSFSRHSASRSVDNLAVRPLRSLSVAFIPRSLRSLSRLLRRGPSTLTYRLIVGGNLMVLPPGDTIDIDSDSEDKHDANAGLYANDDYTAPAPTAPVPAQPIRQPSPLSSPPLRTTPTPGNQNPSLEDKVNEIGRSMLWFQDETVK